MLEVLIKSRNVFNLRAAFVKVIKSAESIGNTDTSQMKFPRFEDGKPLRFGVV